MVLDEKRTQNSPQHVIAVTGHSDYWRTDTVITGYYNSPPKIYWGDHNISINFRNSHTGDTKQHLEAYHKPNNSDQKQIQTG